MLSYRLCLALGCLHPDYLSKRLSARQFLGWQVYDSLEPIGTFYSAGIVAAAVQNFSMMKKKGKWFSAYDFIPKFRNIFKKQPVKEMETMLRAMVDINKKEDKSG